MTRSTASRSWPAGSSSGRHWTARSARLLALGGLLAGCAGFAGAPADVQPASKDSGAIEITAAPDAGGVLSFRNCPTLEEATAAMPAITAGPGANGVPFKSMVLQCSYALPGRDVQGRELGISILVFDAAFENTAVWHWPVDSDFGEPEPVAGLGDSAFVSERDGERHVWVETGRFGLHVMGSAGLDREGVLALTQAAVEGLKRPPR